MKRGILVFAFALLSQSAFSQPLQGTVSSDTDQRVEGAYILNLRTGIHDHTNASGRYILPDTRVGDSVVVSRLGFVPQRLRVASLTTPLTIILKSAPILLDQVQVTGSINPLQTLADIDMKVSPVLSSQELLRKTPGLFIGQHAGGGKAEQLFLRGFDIDHGTDVAISVDNMPVNMVSHAHGQGYADLHFVIPETVEKFDFGKGPYYADRGNLATAGYVNLQTATVLHKNYVSMEGGQFSTYRMVGMINLLPAGSEHRAYLAVENYLTEGAFDSPQHLNRSNWMLRYFGNLDESNQLKLTLSSFSSRWDASGQIPERAVKSGAISRFGAIDDTEGGSTGRNSLMAEHLNFLDNGAFIKTNAWYSQYRFDLFSNFTFFLTDSVNGDQIRQREDRTLAGVQTAYHHSLSFRGWDIKYRAGSGFRSDEVLNIQLLNTKDRLETLDSLASGDVYEDNWYGFVDAEFSYGDWSLIPGLRVDYFRFTYLNDLLVPFRTKSYSDYFIGPKMNVLYSPIETVQLFLKTGIGFHSNDTRVIATKIGEKMVTSATGADLGVVWKPMPSLVLTSAIWMLNMEQEFVYVGDGGVVEPSGESRRLGWDFSSRYQILSWLFADMDLNYAHARALNEPSGQDFIPLAPEWTSTGGLTVNHESGFRSSLKYRWMGDRPANEDNSIVAKGYFITDVMIGYQWQSWFVEVSIENLFDSEWKETQFATETRLLGESAPVEEIHFIPGTPFFIKLKSGFEF